MLATPWGQTLSCTMPQCRNSWEQTLLAQRVAQVELPSGAAGDDQFGGCRTVEHSYVKNKQIGEGTYGQVRLVPRIVLCTCTPGMHCAWGLSSALRAPCLHSMYTVVSGAPEACPQRLHKCSQGNKQKGGALSC